MVVRCNTQGRDLGSVVADIENRINSRIRMPEGYYVEYAGQFESQRSATLMISLLAAVSLIGVFVVLLMLMPSVRVVLQILNAIPTAFIGGVAALALTGQTLTVASLVGFISLGGIAVRNGILLVTHGKLGDVLLGQQAPGRLGVTRVSPAAAVDDSIKHVLHIRRKAWQGPREIH